MLLGRELHGHRVFARQLREHPDDGGHRHLCGVWAGATEVTAQADAGGQPQPIFVRVWSPSAGSWHCRRELRATYREIGRRDGRRRLSGFQGASRRSAHPQPSVEARPHRLHQSGVCVQIEPGIPRYRGYPDNSNGQQAMVATREPVGVWAPAAGVDRPAGQCPEQPSMVASAPSPAPWPGPVPPQGAARGALSGNQQALAAAPKSAHHRRGGPCAGDICCRIRRSPFWRTRFGTSPTWDPDPGSLWGRWLPSPASNLLLSNSLRLWKAGQGPLDCVGLLISSYSDNQITFSLGSGYPIFGPLANGDRFSVAVLGSTFTGTVAFGPATLFTCNVSGFGTATFPVAVSESPAPPVAIDAGGTFQVRSSAQVTIPASVINHFRGIGATSLTVSSQTTAEAGRVSVGGALSGAVSPNAEAASASNLPVGDATLVADTPFTYSTAYNPVTWQTGPGTGKVYFTPGDIDAEVTFVIHGTPTPESISCTPPHGVAALGLHHGRPPPGHPHLPGAPPTPPLQNQVSAGTDGGWGADHRQHLDGTVTGLSASVTVSDGHAPVFDLTGMAASGQLWGRRVG